MRRLEDVSTCAVCSQGIDWNGEAWEHQVTGVWANAPVRHQAIPVPRPRPPLTANQQGQDVG